MRTVGHALTVLVLLVLTPCIVHAQASITGTVKDTSGSVLPGVTVEATSPALIERLRTVISDGTGQYRIQDLRPGVYVVTFTLAGFKTVQRQGVELAGSFTATINAELQVGALEETITVTGETPVVDVQATRQQQVINHDIIDALPTGKSDRALAALVPGVVGGQDAGGALTAQTGVSIHGGPSGTFMQSGVAITSGFGDNGNSQVLPNMAAFQEVVVDTGAVSAEMTSGGIRINFVPRDGGNTYTGTVFANFADHAMQGNNYSSALQAEGLGAPVSIKRMWDVNPGFGGPIARDKLWFYATFREFNVGVYPAGSLFNLNANKPDVWRYAPDTDGPRPSNDSTFTDFTGRLTWQTSAKNKIGLSWTEQPQCLCLERVSATTAPEAAVARHFLMRNVIADWNSPVNNRVLLEAAAIPRRLERVRRELPDFTNPAMVSVIDQGLGNLIYRAPLGFNDTSAPQRNTTYITSFYRLAASYITGAHAVQVGTTFGQTADPALSFAPTQPYSYRFNNGVPNQITLLAVPSTLEFQADVDLGVYAQDKWTRSGLTLTYGARYDKFKTSYPAQTLGPGPLVPTRNYTLPETPGVSWNDISPKVGMAYDVFGNGKTALKATLNKYVQGGGDGGAFGLALAPGNLIVTSTTRSWTDNGNFIPDCDLTNPALQDNRATGGDLCGAFAASNFGQARAGSAYDPDTLSGWGKRGFSWEFSTGVQQELRPRVALTLSYFRRWYGNFIVTDDRSVAASEFSAFSITAPDTDTRLPTAGSTITGIYNLVPAAFGRAADNFVTYAKNYGTQIQHWNGVDVLLNARPRPGMMLQGGISTGRTSTDNCEVAAKVPEALLVGTVWTPLQYCHQDTKFLTQLKLVGTYTVPKIDLQISPVLQSLPGPVILANWAAPNAVVAPSLGRNLSGNAANITVGLLSPGTMYGERSNVMDLRLAKILRLAGLRTSLNVDVYNLFNSSDVLTQNNTFGGTARWLTPQSIPLARYAKISAQIDF